MDGWIKLHRQITRSSKFADPDILRLWILCLTKASHRGGSVLVEKQEIHLQPGQFVTGRFSLQHEYNEQLSPRNKVKDTTLWSWLKRLEQWGDIDIKSTNKYSLITVVKWSEYQETLTTESQQIDNGNTTKQQQTDTNKNVRTKERKNEKIEKTLFAPNVALTDDEYKRLCSEFGEDFTKMSIEYLSSYKLEKNYKTKSDNLTIRRWVMDAVKKSKVVMLPRNNQSQYQRTKSKLEQMQEEAEAREREQFGYHQTGTDSFG